MCANLPSTPAEVLEISTRALKFKTCLTVALAKWFGRWRYPFKEAATTFEEMTLEDIFYWVYKCKNPILRMEEGSAFPKSDKNMVRLPDGFEKTSTVTLGAAGDLLRADGLEKSQGLLFKSVADLLFDCDVSFTNYESPITTQPLQKEIISDRGAPVECSSREQFETLFKGHKGKVFDVMNVSNNHMFDMGVEGIEGTLQAMKDNGICFIGANETPEQAGHGKILEKNGIKIGFAAATFGLNGRVMPEEEAYRLNVSNLLSKFAEPDLQLLKSQIEDCKAQGCDFIIASIHWGFEFEFFPRARQIEANHAVIEMGADAILAHHPHVIQPVEYYRTKRDADRVAVIAHSLGTATWGYTAPHLVLSLILNMRLAKGCLNGEEKTLIESTQVTPVFRSAIDKGDGVETRLEKLDDHLNGKSTRHTQRYINAIKRYADLVLAGST